ncbi:MAG: methyltransferase domain-containing protein [Demequina sp.]
MTERRSDSHRAPARVSAQTWDAASYQANTPFVAEYGNDVAALLDPQLGERVLDIGCGDGVLTRRLMESGATVVGVDTSEEFVAAARQAGVDARLCDVQQLDFDGEFDAAFTNAVLHWVPDHDAMARGVRAALIPGGRFVGEFGGFGNVAAISSVLRAVASHYGVEPSAAAPYTNPGAEEFTQTLTRAGFQVKHAELFARPTPLPTGLRGWLETTRGTFLDAFGDAREQALADTLAALEPSLRAASGEWYADYVRLRFSAIRL